MATDYFSDDEAYITNQPLPSPSGTPYHSLSQRTSRYGTPMGEAAGSPAPMPPFPQGNAENNHADEKVSILDPRRFTPTLHASLVSEILSLRRELDSKHKFIESLETSFHAARNESDSLVDQLSTSTKENRTVKRQLQQLENGTLSALEEMVGEKDRLQEANGDLKQRLEASRKKLQSQEEDSTRVHDMWANEKEKWTGEKRSLERRVHVSESRMKMLLDEIALQEAAQEDAEFESEVEDPPRDSGVGPESDAGSVRSSPQRRPSTRLARHSRNLSNSSYRSIGRNYRMSLMSEGPARVPGVSLADELFFDEEEEDLGELELDSDDYPEYEMRARRALESRQSMRQDDKAKRILGLSTEGESSNRDGPAVTEAEAPKAVYEMTTPSINVTPQEVTLVFPPPKPEPINARPEYVDTGVQPSPPQSPVRPGTAGSFRLVEALSVTEIEANQSRKRVSAPSSPSLQPTHIAPVPYLMTSTSSQTIEPPLSPPATPIVASPITETTVPTSNPQFASISTQTEPFEGPEKPQAESPPQPKRPPPPVPIAIPSIAIHAPTSAPSSPKEPILPPGTKSTATQTSSGMISNMRSTSMQTEPIRIDQRPVKLPAHLLPSAVRSTPSTPDPERVAASNVIRKDSHQPFVSASEKSSAVPSARQDLMTLLEKVTNTTVEDRYPGNNDNGPLVHEKENGISRPFRTSSLFAGFDGRSSDEEGMDGELSDEEDRAHQYSMPMLSSRNVKNGRVFNSPPTPVPEEKESSPARPSEESIRPIKTSTRDSFDRPAKVGKTSRKSLGRQPSIRRSAMISNGTAAHNHSRSRSPSIGSLNSARLIGKPPFPVPTRSSSRKVPSSKSEGSQSPTPRNNGNFPGRRAYGARPPQRQDSLRKVRSAAVMQKPRRPRSRSPPLPASPIVPPSPSLPPMPSDMLTGQNFGHRHQLSTNTAYTGTETVGSVGYQTSVVDAIAVAMVGEWMWKYVRKRKAFGGQESPADVARAGEDSVMTSNGVRHKRWVWISPYERSVLWSNKQPTTGSALLGKSGRKLTIQSVLDVADNSPIPKNAGAQVLFNRSILILTPARALKFTTTSQERHYVWLTALSFLAHSSSPIPNLGPAPPVPPPVEEMPQYQPIGATLRRSHVRDSVRLAKGRTNPVAQRFQPHCEPMPELYGGYQPEKPLPASASPPVIPRGPSHSRKRSSTGPGAPPPPVPFRSFSHQQVPSIYSSGSSDMYSSAQPPSVPSSVYNPHSVVASSRTSEASTSTRQHFFDTMGTVRMEAFIDDSLGREPVPKQGFAGSRMGRRRGNSQWSGGTHDPHRVGGLSEDFMAESNDPFRGF